MDSQQIHDLLLAIAADSSRTGKESLLASHADSEQLKQVLQYAYSPFITFGVAEKTFPPIPAPTSHSADPNFSEATWVLLRKLASREYSGSVAIACLQEELRHLNIQSALLLKNIVCKDLRCGMNEKTINKVIPGLIPTFDCALATPFEKTSLLWPMVADIKLDGLRTLAYVDVKSNSVHYFSRNGLAVHTMDHCSMPLLEACHRANTGNVVIDGEAVVPGSFNQSVSAVKRKQKGEVQAQYALFDVIFAHHWSAKTSLPYWQRRGILEAMRVGYNTSPVKILPVCEVRSEQYLHECYDSALNNGYEGLVLKDPNALYAYKRSKAWIKMKAEKSEDLLVVDVFEGTGKYAGMLGGIVVNMKGVLVKVGTGFSDLDREFLWAVSPVGQVAEIMFHEVTPDGSLRHPRFKRFRKDKS